MFSGYYINLDSRLDRKLNFEDLQTKNSFFNKVERFSAYRHKNGSIGCGLSHIEVLKNCLEKDEPAFLVCEDDLTILNEERFRNMSKNLVLEDDWDVITLTPRGDKVVGDELPGEFVRIQNNQTTTAYIIKKRMVPILIANLEEAIHGLSQGGDPNIYSIDQYWKRLQIEYKFYYYKHIYAGQLVGYSDVEKRMVDYNDRFLMQPHY
jgi:GR25 family glycosyltransferase involved in LPS biosynthesis